jgi:hypothetical protein
VTYTLNPPRYDAHQWTLGANVAAFTAIIDPAGSMTWHVNDDGSLNYEAVWAGSASIPVNGWVVSIPFWTSVSWQFPTATTGSPSGNPFFTDAEFTSQFTTAA